MSRATRPADRWLTFAVLALAPALAPAGPGDQPLPRFTEEREAAALHFTRKHLPELLPVLQDLQKNHRGQYEREVSEIFQVTEWLADLQDRPRRHDLELRIWKAENRAWLLASRLAGAGEEDRKKADGELRQIARELVDLETSSLEMQVEELESELDGVKEELARARDSVERRVSDRREALLKQASRRGH
jgi:flagellar motility protein MotE (MotC chaperone)